MRYKNLVMLAGVMFVMAGGLFAPAVVRADGCEAIDKSISTYETQLPKFPRYCTIGQFLQRLLNILFSAIGAIALIFIVIGGYQYMTARGNEEQATGARKTVIYAVVGLIVVILSVTLVNILVKLILYG